MLRLIRGGSAAPALAIAIGVAAAGICVARPALASPAGSPGSGNGCYAIENTWICVYSQSSSGRPGSRGASSYACSYKPASAVMLGRIGPGQPDPGYRWDILTCAGPPSGPGALVEVSRQTGEPRIAPVQLLTISIGYLIVPALTPATAPPRGMDGLVGLPEWFWVPSGRWRAASVTLRAGPVWATATATPTRLTYSPGGGFGPVSCAGPGIPFKVGVPAGAQHTACSYNYTRSSAGQPGDTYHAALCVTWTISWVGSGGAGGLITSGYTTSVAFSLRIAQAEALVSAP